MKMLMFVSMFSCFTKFSFSKESKYFSKNGFFINGYDLVSYITEEIAVKGTKEFSHEFDGTKVLFKNEANKKLFIKDPKKYIPAYKGWCAYAMANDGGLVEVDPEKFRLINGKTYFFYNGIWADTLEKWEKKEDAPQIKKADKNWLKYKK